MKFAITAAAAMALGLMLAGAGDDAWSDETPPPGGDIDAGKAVAALCAGCHGLDGMSRISEVPYLAGQHAEYLLNAMAAYKEGTRNDPEMRAMQEVAARLSADDIANVAAYFASLRSFKHAGAGGAAEPAPAMPDETDPFAAVKEATAACAGCHGEDGNSDIPGTPGLAGQHATYLINALKAYRDGVRSDDVMSAFVEDLSDVDIEDMAYYYASMEPKPAAPPTTGDPYAGLAATAACAGCHGEDGNGQDPKTPRLAGLDADYLAATIAAYKDGRRKHDVMRDAVLALREQDITNGMAYYATKAPKALPVRKPLTVKQWTDTCDRCHGPNGDSQDPRFPVLAGQSFTYLTNALKLFHGRGRENPLMYAMTFPMGESDIEKLANFYARQVVQE